MKNEKKKIILTDQEKIILSRIYKLDRQIAIYIKNRPNESTNKLLAKTDFIKKANALYKEASKQVITISIKNTRHTHNLVDLSSFLS